MKKQIIGFLILFNIMAVSSAFAAQVRVFVADMAAIGAPNKDEMKLTLQALLSSRLNKDGIIAVGSAAEADVIVTGTYVTIGKIFSVDAIAKSVTGKTLTRTFVQGEGQDELIPSLGKLADKLSGELLTVYSTGQTTDTSVSRVLSASMPASVTKSDFIKNDPHVRQAQSSEIVKPAEYERGGTGGWLSKRLEGAINVMAVGKSFPDGSRDIFMADNRHLFYYRQNAEMKLMDETEFRTTEKVLSVDTIEAPNGDLDLYVTIVRSENLESQVWQAKGDKLVKIAEKLPYFFRSFALAGGPKKIYAQPMGPNTDFFGPVSEVTRTGSSIQLKAPISMPRYGDIYSFNQFRDAQGKTLTIAINQDGYLVVYNQELQEVWRSNDKFGGSELFFQKEDADPRISGNKFRFIFMNQRIQVTSKNEVLVGKNEGFWVMGDARSYKKGAVYNMVWNGSSLEEKWRTKDTQNYMPDYTYDEARNELLILQTVQRPGFTGRGASSLAIKKVE